MAAIAKIPDRAEAPEIMCRSARTATLDKLKRAGTPEKLERTRISLSRSGKAGVAERFE